MSHELCKASLPLVAENARCTPCLACGDDASDLIEMLSLRQQHLKYANGDGSVADNLDTAFGSQLDRYQIWRCSQCRLEFTEPALSPPERWYGELYRHLQLYPQARWEFAEVLAALNPGDVVFDYGCGSGEFLHSARDRVKRSAGFDFSKAAVQAASARGLKAHVLDLGGSSSVAQFRGQANHIVAFHVLEHLSRPKATFEFAAAVAAPDAALWIAVPSDRRPSRLYGEEDSLDAPPHHLTRWTVAALEQIGTRSGWSLQRHSYEPIPERTAVWEATRRLPAFKFTNSMWRPMSWIARRALASGAWMTGLHRRMNTSGFSMLACYRQSKPR